MSTALKQGFVTEDGQVFTNRNDALEHIRKPQVMSVLTVLCNKDADLASFLYEKREDIAAAYDTGKIPRVTKSQRKALEKALEYAVSLNDPKLEFINKHYEDISASFRWPTVSRLKPEEHAGAIQEALAKLVDGNTELAVWIINNKDQLLAAYETGVEKREVNPKAMEKLAEYRAQRAADAERMRKEDEAVKDDPVAKEKLAKARAQAKVKAAEEKAAAKAAEAAAKEAAKAK